MGLTYSLLLRLLDRNVDLVLVGGMAAIVHGAVTVTEDLDACVRFDEPTLERILAALAPLHARHRFHPDHPPLQADVAYLSTFKNLYLTTDEGPLDLLGSITGLGDFEAVLARSVEVEVDGRPLRVLGLDALIDAKRALGREKDRTRLAELEALQRRLHEKD